MICTKLVTIGSIEPGTWKTKQYFQAHLNQAFFQYLGHICTNNAEGGQLHTKYWSYNKKIIMIHGNTVPVAYDNESHYCLIANTKV